MNNYRIFGAGSQQPQQQPQSQQQPWLQQQQQQQQQQQPMANAAAFYPSPAAYHQQGQWNGYPLGPNPINQVVGGQAQVNFPGQPSLPLVNNVGAQPPAVPLASARQLGESEEQYEKRVEGMRLARVATNEEWFDIAEDRRKEFVKRGANSLGQRKRAETIKRKKASKATGKEVSTVRAEQAQRRRAKEQCRALTAGPSAPAPALAPAPIPALVLPPAPVPALAPAPARLPALVLALEDDFEVGGHFRHAMEAGQPDLDMFQPLAIDRPEFWDNLVLPLGDQGQPAGHGHEPPLDGNEAIKELLLEAINEE
ncbi:hypothetical protein QBC40DRAFT_319218 [Triangularia verruculosa]|uniref:Uncharacterized protein n=1 Tax=Triangularia verruculosa TaxID=2587418 RepID=A0AAN6XMK6_9PEZI|nr:hypothetical protein QBC40DRAFT_319218 [Triangularia verruculosa]